MGPPAPPTPRALLIDIGGVLVENHWRNVAREIVSSAPLGAAAAERALFELCPAFDLGEDSLAALHEKFVDRTGIKVELDAFRTSVLDSALRLMPANLDRVRRLRTRHAVRVIAVSNMAAIIWDALEAKFRLSSVLDGAVLSSACHSAKPDAAIFLAAVALAGHSAAECVFVDDSETNVRGAIAVGIRAMRTSGTPEDFEAVLGECFPESRGS